MGATMNFLIVYASTEGQTNKIAKFMAGLLTNAGHQVRFHNVSDVSDGLAITDYDHVIVAGSVHSGKHQPDLQLFVYANRERLNKLPSLLVSVSLAAAFPDTQSEAQGYVDAFLEATEWQPTHTLLTAGAIKPGIYDWFQKSALLEGDLAAHVDEDLQDTREFTDWDALKQKTAELTAT